MEGSRAPGSGLTEHDGDDADPSDGEASEEAHDHEHHVGIGERADHGKEYGQEVGHH